MSETPAPRTPGQGSGPQAASAPKRSGETVTVALRYPHGIVLQLYTMEDVQVPAPLGFIIQKQARKKGEPFTLNGYAAEAGKSPNCIVAGGYALTPGVPRDLYEQWLKDNADHDIVRNKLIFAFPTLDRARDAGEERAGVLCGLEPLNPVLREDARVPEARSRMMRIEPGVR